MLEVTVELPDGGEKTFTADNEEELEAMINDFMDEEYPDPTPEA